MAAPCDADVFRWRVPCPAWARGWRAGRSSRDHASGASCGEPGATSSGGGVCYDAAGPSRRGKRHRGRPLLWTDGHAREIVSLLARGGDRRPACRSEPVRRPCHGRSGVGSDPPRPSMPWSTDWRSGAPYGHHLRPLFVRWYPTDPGHDRGAEVKVPWELGRFAHLCVLAQAYSITQRPCYSLEAAAQVADFIHRCPRLAECSGLSYGRRSSGGQLGVEPPATPWRPRLGR